MAAAAASLEKMRHSNRDSPSRHRHQSSPSPTGSLLALNTDVPMKPVYSDALERQDVFNSAPTGPARENSVDREEGMPDDRSSEEKEDVHNDYIGRGEADMPRLTPRMVKNQYRRKKNDGVRRSRSNIDITVSDHEESPPRLSRSSSSEDLTAVEKKNNNKVKYVPKSPRQIGSKINDAILSELEHENQLHERRIMNTGSTNGLTKQLTTPPKLMTSLSYQKPQPSLPSPNALTFDAYIYKKDGRTSDVQPDKRASQTKAEKKPPDVKPDNKTSEIRQDNKAVNKNKFRENIENEKNKTNINFTKEKPPKEETKKEHSPKHEGKGEGVHRTNIKKGFPIQPHKLRLRSRSVSPQRRKEKVSW